MVNKMDKIIVIDPGHGGEDRKNKGPSGYVEADGVLKISYYLYCFLNTIAGFKSFLTRNTDKTLKLQERAEIAKKLNADLFISEHTNAGIGKLPAVEVFESVDLNDDKFADQMAFLISNNLNIGNRGGKQWESTKNPGEDYLTVIDHSQDLGIKHVFLVETCNHDIASGEAILKVNMNLMISAISQGIVISRIFNNELEFNRELVLTNQKLLNNHGYKLALDGIYGAKTGAAIMDFQEKNKLTLNGLPSSNLLQKLDIPVKKYKTPDEVYKECLFEPDKYQNALLYLKENLHVLPDELHPLKDSDLVNLKCYYHDKNIKL